MARFVSRIRVAAGPEAVFGLLTDWPAHARWVPLTTITVLTGRPDGVGARFVGRSAIGPLGFDDVMEVVDWRPPVGGGAGLCTVAKIGRVLTGSATLEVRPVPGGTDVSWTEDVQLAPARLTRPLGPLLSLVGRLGFDRALRQMRAELERGRG